jgi:hypothetical protein
MWCGTWITTGCERDITCEECCCCPEHCRIFHDRAVTIAEVQALLEQAGRTIKPTTGAGQGQVETEAIRING